MQKSNPRQICHDLLVQWNPHTNFATNLIEGASRHHQLESRERAFLNSLVLGVLRNITLLDHWIDQLRGRGQLKKNVRWLLRQGLCEVLLMRTPDHAAVSQTVKLAKRYEKGVVNAILRRATTESDSLLSHVESLPLSSRYSLPKHLVERWENRMGMDATLALCQWINEPATVTMRANPLIPDAATQLVQSFGASPVDDQPGFFTTAELPLNALKAGLCYIQDPSTAAAPTLLAPRPGDTVLDACAAPGGKSGILAALMENRGRLVCIDGQTERIDMTRDNLQRLSVTCAETATYDWLSAKPLPDTVAREPFDHILLDVPCSNTGVLRRRVDVRWRLTSASTFTELQDTQLAIVERMIPLLKPGGTLVYSTCSIEPDENEHLVAQILDRHPALTKREETILLPYINDTDGAYAAALIHE